MINLFYWLTWDNKILILDNLTKQDCNQCFSDTCVVCHHAKKKKQLITCFLNVALQSVFGPTADFPLVHISCLDLLNPTNGNPTSYIMGSPAQSYFLEYLA